MAAVYFAYFLKFFSLLSFYLFSRKVRESQQCTCDQNTVEQEVLNKTAMSSSNFLIVKVTEERERGNLLCLQNNGSSHQNPPLKERMTARSPSQSTARLASLAVCFCFCFFVFAVSPRFLPFPPAAEPSSRLIHFKLEFLEDKYWTC